MKNEELEAYAKKDYLREVRPSLRRKVQPFFSELIAQLISSPEGSSREEILKLFESCVKNINKYEDEIETVDREAILGAAYEIGAIVGLDPESRFAEQWRGDW